METRAGRVRVRPQVRYTRWGTDANEDPYLHSNYNQVDVLIGFAIGGR